MEVINCENYGVLLSTPQIVSVAALIYTPLLCSNTIAIPIIAAYCGVIMRCVINVVACYKMTFWQLSKKVKVSYVYMYEYGTCTYVWYMYVYIMYGTCTCMYGTCTYTHVFGESLNETQGEAMSFIYNYTVNACHKAHVVVKHTSTAKCVLLTHLTPCLLSTCITVHSQRILHIS